MSLIPEVSGEKSSTKIPTWDGSEETFTMFKNRIIAWIGSKGLKYQHAIQRIGIYEGLTYKPSYTVKDYSSTTLSKDPQASFNDICQKLYNLLLNSLQGEAAKKLVNSSIVFGDGVGV